MSAYGCYRIMVVLYEYVHGKKSLIIVDKLFSKLCVYTVVSAPTEILYLWKLYCVLQSMQMLY